jgi:hypothetical protein
MVTAMTRLDELTSWRTVLALVIIIIGLTIGFYWIRSQWTNTPQTVSASESERNERSTPRSFILPATPAVAFEQEMRADGSSTGAKMEKQLAKCAVHLLALGYDVGDEAVAFNAKLAEAIYRYQESRGIFATGRLDAATISRLGCKST